MKIYFCFFFLENFKMPTRLTINDVRERIEKYGYYIQDGEK